MKVLVLGSNGQLGQCLKKQIQDNNFNVIYSSRDEIDISSFEKTKKQILDIKPQVIINASAYTAVDKAEKEQKEANLINHLAVRNIASTCNQLDCWLVHFSTDYVFDGKSSVAYKEEDKTNPLGIYGYSKLMGEREIQSSGCRYIIIRTAWVFSEYGNNFLKNMLHLGPKYSELRVVGDQVGCPTYAQDIAKVIMTILMSLKSKKVSSCLYHYSGNYCVSWADFAESIFEEALKLNIVKNKPKILNITTKQFPTLAERPKRSELNSSKISSVFEITPSDFIAGIRSSLTAIKKQKINNK